jgi:RND family efflux transporter MFP subunit
MQQAAGELKRATQQAQRIQAAYGQGLSQAVLKTAQVTVDEAAGAIERAKQNLQRLQVADAEQLIPKTELDKAQAALETAQVHYWEAKEALLRTQKDLRLEVEQAQAALEAAHVRYQSAEEQLLRTQRELQRTTLVTPVSGMVMERLINPDETPQATQKLFTIGRIDQVLVETKIAQEWIGTVRLWQPGSATFQAFPNDELEGTVVKIQPVTDPQTKTFLVYLKIANPDLRLKPGMSSFVRLHSQHQGLAVPSVALLNPTGGPESSVFVVGPDAHARLQKVQVGKVADGMTEILGGLVRGEQVVVIGQFYLEDGDKVRITDTLEGVRNAGAVAYD